MVRERESYRISETMLREQGGEIGLEVEAGGIVKRKIIKVFVDPEDGVLSSTAHESKNLPGVADWRRKSAWCCRLEEKFCLDNLPPSSYLIFCM